MIPFNHDNFKNLVKENAELKELVSRLTAQVVLADKEVASKQTRKGKAKE